MILIGRSDSTKPITIGLSYWENMEPNSLLPIETWYKSFTGKFRTKITRSRLTEKRETDDFWSWYHNGRCGNVIYVCWYESVTASSVSAYGDVHVTARFGHAMFDRYVYVDNVIEYIQTVNTGQNRFNKMFRGSLRILVMAILLMK